MRRIKQPAVVAVLSPLTGQKVTVRRTGGGTLIAPARMILTDHRLTQDSCGEAGVFARPLLHTRRR